MHLGCIYSAFRVHLGCMYGAFMVRLGCIGRLVIDQIKAKPIKDKQIHVTCNEIPVMICKLNERDWCT